jgi:hypothetical protein
MCRPDKRVQLSEEPAAGNNFNHHAAMASAQRSECTIGKDSADHYSMRDVKQALPSGAQYAAQGEPILDLHSTSLHSRRRDDEQMRQALTYQGEASYRHRNSTKPQNAGIAPDILYNPPPSGQISKDTQMRDALRYDPGAYCHRVSERPQNIQHSPQADYSHVARGANYETEGMWSAMRLADHQDPSSRLSSKPQNAKPVSLEDYKHVPRGSDYEHPDMRAAMQYPSQLIPSRRVSTKPQNMQHAPLTEYSHVQRGTDYEHPEMRTAMQHEDSTSPSRRDSTKPQNIQHAPLSEYCHVRRGTDYEHPDMRAAMKHEGSTSPSRRVSSRPQNYAPSMSEREPQVARGMDREHADMKAAMGFGGESTSFYSHDESRPQNAVQASDAYHTASRHATSRQGHMHQVLDQGISSFLARSAEQLESSKARFPYAFSQTSSANGV